MESSPVTEHHQMQVISHTHGERATVELYVGNQPEKKTNLRIATYSCITYGTLLEVVPEMLKHDVPLAQGHKLRG